ncbi:12620_t:CDS:2 [Dentiscutata erythropus]|uniref:12620_t:CDS:1 n=1 Tax=Dentiscutata erythropus TaxID=1348616 RepID=A0A9N9NAG5_9GLOM|nr:12620_t:CDS:2 [Dentiscutata erythropus]
MSSIETNNGKGFPSAKQFRRRLSFRNKPTPVPEPISINGLNSVRGSIRRFRRVSGSVSSAQTSSDSTTDPTNINQSASNSQSPTFPSFPRLYNIASIAREFKEINLSQKTADLTAAVTEMGVELGKKGAELSSMAKDVVKDAVVDRWKKRKEDSSSNNLLNTKRFVSRENIFGAPLKIAVTLTRVEKDMKQIYKDPSRYWVPALVLRCIEFLDIHGLEEVGIYRIPGSMSAVQRMRGIFNSGLDLNFLQSSREDPHVVATLLKMYLRELPEPILTEELLPDFGACVAKHTNSDLNAIPPAIIPGSGTRQMSTAYFTAPTVVPETLPHDLATIISRLPPYHFYTLRALFSHLARVDSNNDVNKMTLSNLGLIFCPSLGIGSILFKSFICHLDIVFGKGCNSEEAEIELEKREQQVKEKRAPQVYHKTYISEDFSKSFEDLLMIDRHPSANSSSNSYPSSSSSSIKGLPVNKDDIDTHNNNQSDSMKNFAVNNTFSKISPLSSSSSITAPSTPPSKDSSKDTNNQFNYDEFHEKRNHSLVEKLSKTSSVFSPSFRLRSSSVPLKVIELSDFSESEEEQNLTEDEGSNEINSPTLMSFDYLDRYGTKKGLLNLTSRVSNNWISQHNGANDGKNVRRRRPSVEEREKWKKTLVTSTSANAPPNITEDLVVTSEEDKMDEDKMDEDKMDEEKIPSQLN